MGNCLKNQNQEKQATNDKLSSEGGISNGFIEYNGKIDLLLQRDSSGEEITKFRAWLKRAASTFAVDPSPYDCFLLYEAIAKRVNTFVSGQKCGESKEVGQEILEKNANAIIEKFGDSVLKKLKTWPPGTDEIDKTKLELFTEISASVLQQVKEFIANNNQVKS